MFLDREQSCLLAACGAIGELMTPYIPYFIARLSSGRSLDRVDGAHFSYKSDICENNGASLDYQSHLFSTAWAVAMGDGTIIYIITHRHMSGGIPICYLLMRSRSFFTTTPSSAMYTETTLHVGPPPLPPWWSGAPVGHLMYPAQATLHLHPY